MRRIVIGLLALAWTGSVPIAEQNPFLGGDGPIYPNPVSTGFYNSYAMVEGDFNEDGVEDYIAFGVDFTHVLLGNGDCTFQRYPFQRYTRGGGSIGDFNEDGHQDVVATIEAPSIEVSLGNGDGFFQPPVRYTVPGGFIGQMSWPTAVADFDEDGHQDVLMGWSNNNNPFAFFSGNGDGTFDTPVTFGNGGTWDFGVGDFNKDTHLDFVAGVGFGQGEIRVWLGTGTGAFIDAGSYDVGSGNPWEFVVFDFDGDTNLDVAVADSSGDCVFVLLGNGDGTLHQPPPSYGVGNQPYFMVHGDFDSDGNEDLLVSYRGETFLSLLTGNGDGTFDPEVQLPQIYSPGPIVASDLDDDGYLDVVLAMTSGAFQVLRGQGDGIFGPDPALVVSPFAGDVVEVTFGDLNNDGRQDAAIASANGTNSVTIRLASGTGAFNVTATLPSFVAPSGLAIADVTNDSNGDVIVTTDLNIAIFPGQGDGTFGPEVSLSQEAVAITTGLFNADANVDLAVASTSTGPEIDIQLGNGDATFNPGGSFAVGPDPAKIVTGDFNEDTVTDLAVFNEGTAEVSVLIGVGDGTFQPEVRYPLMSPVPPALKVFDVNEDGHEDLVASSRNVFYGVGDGTFSPAFFLGGDGSGAVALADVDGDGRTDFLSAGSNANLRRRLTDGNFGPSKSFMTTGTANLELIADDINGDARNDIIIDGIAVLLNIAQSPFRFGTDKATMTWPDVTGAQSYNVYRGLISSLADGDSDGLPDAGYGDCQNALDPDTTDLHYVDASVPPPGAGYFYLIAIEDWAGEFWLGSTSGGLSRVSTLPCP
jgi:hypothetical protein